MSEMGDLIMVGLLGQPNAAGLTANQAKEIGERVAALTRARVRERVEALPWTNTPIRWGDDITIDEVMGAIG